MRRTFLIAIMVVVAAACSRQEVKQKAEAVKEKVKDAADDIAVPFAGKRDDPTTREQQRFDPRWRDLESFRAKQQAQGNAQTQTGAPPPTDTVVQTNTPPTPPPPASFRFVTGVKETFKGADANTINNAPVRVPVTGDVRGPSVLRAQVYLDRLHLSVGAIDGRWGRNSAITTWWYQRARGLPTTGDLDEQTYRKLAGEVAYAPVVASRTLSQDDVKGPFTPVPEDVYEKAKMKCLCYESLREKLAERFHTTEDFLELLNPDLKFSELKAGDSITVPNVREPLAGDQPDIARIIISSAGNSFNGFDASDRLVFHAPTTLGSGYDPSPTESLHIVKIVRDPHFHYDPTLYHEVDDSEPDAQLPPGPNTPVGVVWMALSKPHYGVHGTPEPDSIGYASSHGCIRLTNWDASEVSHRTNTGTQIAFVDLKPTGMPEVAKKAE